MKEYDEGRIWFRRIGDLITVGLTEKALEEIGAVQRVQLPAEGDEVNQDDVVAEIEGAKLNFEVIAPLDGGIFAVNEPLSEDFESLQGDPLDEGWLFKLKSDLMKKGAENLLRTLFFAAYFTMAFRKSPQRVSRSKVRRE